MTHAHPNLLSVIQLVAFSAGCCVFCFVLATPAPDAWTPSAPPGSRTPSAARAAAAPGGTRRTPGKGHAPAAPGASGVRNILAYHGSFSASVISSCLQMLLFAFAGAVGARWVTYSLLAFGVELSRRKSVRWFIFALAMCLSFTEVNLLASFVWPSPTISRNPAVWLEIMLAAYTRGVCNAKMALPRGVMWLASGHYRSEHVSWMSQIVRACGVASPRGCPQALVGG